jgi:phosphate transport system substrate-binding protein
VAPSLATAQDGSYPISRFLYFYTAGEPTGTSKKFIDWVKGPEGQKVIGDVGYYPLPGAAGSTVPTTVQATVEGSPDAAK